MTWTIEKDFTFDSAHRLPHVPEGHKCGRMHGHTYKVTIRLGGAYLDDAGMVFEYGQLADLVRPIVEELDHRVLNEIEGLENPTTEVLAQWIWRRLDNPLDRFRWSVVVHESSTTRCEYRE